MTWTTPAASRLSPLKGGEARGSKPTRVDFDGPSNGRVSRPCGLQGLPADRQSRLSGSRSMRDRRVAGADLPTWITDQRADVPVLAINQPIEQREPTLQVQNRLEPGLHRFSLVVVNDRGVASEPDLFTVTVRRVVVVDPVRPPVIGPAPVVVEPVRPTLPPVILNPVRPPVAPPITGPVPGPTPVVRSRGAAARKGKKHGPE